jgi:hypothetical protein
LDVTGTARVTTSAYFATASGSVGIGTTTPESKLDVYNSTNLGGTAGNYLLLQTLQNPGGAGGNTVYERTWAYRTGTGTDWTTWSLWTGISVDVSFGTPTTSKTWHWRDPLAEKQHFGSGSTNVMTIGASNVGIGTTSPSFKLDVNGTARVSTSLNIGGTTTDASAILQADSTTKGFLPPRMTATQRTTISSAAVGLMVYQTDSPEGVYVYTSIGWKSLTMV